MLISHPLDASRKKTSSCRPVPGLRGEPARATQPSAVVTGDGDGEGEGEGPTGDGPAPLPHAAATSAIESAAGTVRRIFNPPPRRAFPARRAARPARG